MKRLFTLWLLAAASLAAHAADERPALDARLGALQQQSSLPGFAVAVVSSKAVLYQRGFGHADLQARRPYTLETV